MEETLQASHTTPTSAVSGAFDAVPTTGAIYVERETSDYTVAECAVGGENRRPESGDSAVGSGVGSGGERLGIGEGGGWWGCWGWGAGERGFGC